MSESSTLPKFKQVITASANNSRIEEEQDEAGLNNIKLDTGFIAQANRGFSCKRMCSQRKPHLPQKMLRMF